MKDVFYGFKLGAGFILAQLIFGAVVLAVSFSTLYALGTMLVTTALSK